MSTKRLQIGCFVVSTDLGILGQLGLVGQDRMEKAVYFIVVPCNAVMSRSQGMSTKRLQAGYFVVSTELGIFGAAGYFRVGWRKVSIL